MQMDGGTVDISSETKSRARLDGWDCKICTVVILILITGLTWYYGIQFRRGAWDWSDGAHFQGDVSNAFRWGTRAHNFGLYAFYYNLDNGIFESPNVRNDYPPLRITIATKWREWANRNYPQFTIWQDDYDFTYPMLRMNIIAEAASSILVLLVILSWLRRCAGSECKWYTGISAGMLGMLAFWFNPAIVWDGHCWPQWDVWLIPFFLLAVLLYIHNCCTLSGISLAIGACLKGQLLLAAPVLMLLPLFTFQFGALLRMITGFIFGLGWIIFPFMMPGNEVFRWYSALIVSLLIITPVALNWIKSRWWINLIILVFAMLIVYPWEAPSSTQNREILWRFSPALLLLIVAGSRYLRSDRRIYFYIAVLGIAIFLMMPIFNTSDAWYRFGFAYGTEKFANMMTGTGTYNLLAMMRQYYDWPNGSDEDFTFPLINQTFTITEASRLIYGALLLICIIGGAIHYRRRDPRFLAVMVTPWLLFYMILTQMHGRYPVWAAGMSALLFGVSTGMGLLGVIVSIVSMIGIANNQLAFQRDWWPALYQYLMALNPHLGWILLLATLIYLYHSLIPSRRAELK